MMASSRFVILEHRNPGPGRTDHWDLMLECSDRQALITFEIPQFAFPIPFQSEETASPEDFISGRRLADHRIAYLTYEGAVSRRRGHVSRVAEGHFHLKRARRVNGSQTAIAAIFPWQVELRMADDGLELTFFRKNSVDYHIQYQRS